MMLSPQVTVWKSKRRGYVSFLVCGLCVALNVLAYLPAKTFEEAEATEFTVTLFLLLIFVVSGLTAVILTIKNHRDVPLLALMLITMTFAFMSSLSGAWTRQTRIALQLSYAIVVLILATIRLLAVSRRDN